MPSRLNFSPVTFLFKYNVCRLCWLDLHINDAPNLLQCKFCFNDSHCAYSYISSMNAPTGGYYISI